MRTCCASGSGMMTPYVSRDAHARAWHRRRGTLRVNCIDHVFDIFWIAKGGAAFALFGVHPVPTTHPLVLLGVAALATGGAGGQYGNADAAPATDLAHPKITANIAVVSDYVVRGVSYSDHSPALQGSIDVVDRSGWGAGAWTSQIDEFNGATQEIDLYAAKTFTLAGTELSIGATAFVFPNGKDTNVGDIDVSAARAIGPVDATLTVNYVWPQANLGDKDDLYVSVSGVTPAGRVAGAQISVSG